MELDRTLPQHWSYLLECAGNATVLLLRGMEVSPLRQQHVQSLPCGLCCEGQELPHIRTESTALLYKLSSCMDIENGIENMEI